MVHNLLHTPHQSTAAPSMMSDEDKGEAERAKKAKEKQEKKEKRKMFLLTRREGKKWKG